MSGPSNPGQGSGHQQERESLSDPGARNPTVPIPGDRRSSSQSAASSSPSNGSNNNNNHQVGVLTGLTNLVTSILGSICATFLGLIQYTLSLIRGQGSGGNRSRSDPVTEVSNFIREFESTYGSNHPTFFRGSYNTALNEAKSGLKFLLIYLHCKSHQDTESFCSKTLCHPEVVSYLNRQTSRIIFWSINVESCEGTRVSQIVSEYSYPFLALICLRDNRMTIVRKFEGFLSVEALLRYARLFLHFISWF